MLRKHYITVMAVVGLVGCLVGCPTNSGLDVSPTAFSFDSSRSDTLTLTNPGTDTIAWQILAKPDWISVSPSEGSLRLASQMVAVEAQLSGLPAGSYSSEITVGTSSGNRSIAVTAIVAAEPALAVSPTSLDFGGSETSLTCSVQNVGAGNLDWTISGTLPQGFAIDKQAGETAAGATDTVTVSLDRTGLAPGALSAQFTVASDFGTQVVSIAGLVQAIMVTPGTLDLGPALSSGTFTVHNSGTSPFDWTIDAGSVPAWIQLSPTSGTLAAGADATVTVTIDRSGLSTGTSQARIAVTSNGAGSVTMAIVAQGPTPHLVAAPLALDFASSETSLSFTIQNAGTGTLKWTLVEGTGTDTAFTASTVPWLAVSPASGETAAAGNTVVTVTVDRSQATPNADTPYQATIRVSSDDGERAFVTVSQLTLPPALSVVPMHLDFGTSTTVITVAIWNGGVGTATWTVDTSLAPSWIKFGSDTSGSVSGNETAMLLVSGDRSGLVPADTDYLWAFQITGTDGTGAALAPVALTASINVARVPAIGIDTGKSPAGAPNVDDSGTAFVPMGTTDTSDTFYISNQGTATLNWTIDVSGLPGWLKSIEPSQGAIEPLQQVAVTVTVDRTGLSFGSLAFALDIASNDPTHKDTTVRVEIAVPKQIIIATQPARIDMGLYGISDAFQVANTGDSGSTLRYQITSNKPWCYVYPETGSSTGTGDTTKDWQGENVSIDRSQLNQAGDSATLTISAYDTDAQGNLVVLKEVTPLAFAVSVEAAPLSFEAAAARTRIPSLVRFVLLMRDVTYRPIPLPLDLLKPVGDAFSIFEQDAAVERIEAGQFLTSGANLRTNVVILLDYSGSMYQAVQTVGDQSIAGAADPLQALYELCAGALIDSLPAHFTVGLMEFHDREQASRLVLGTDGGPAFISDKTVLHERLRSIAITDHGATELLPAVEDAAIELNYKDSGSMMIPFDDTDVRALICITDGRLTTPPGNIKDAITILSGTRARFMGIGWGNNVFHEPLAELAAGSGGHYYPTAEEPTGQTGSDGKPVLRPVVSALQKWCAPPLTPCDMSVGQDLSSQVVFSYVTLREESPVKVQLDATFDNPNDDTGTCEADQGVISGSFIQGGLDFLSIMGDVRLGQISLHTTGIQGGKASVVVRAEYVPRNVNALSFQISCAEPFTVSLVAAADGGIVPDWTLADLGGGAYSLTRPATVTPLQYGAFGDLVRVDFNAVPAGTATFNMQFAVTAPVYDAGNAQGKYFTCPDSIDVSTGDFLAPAFPTPAILFTGGGSAIDFGAGNSVATFQIRNIGGSNLATNVVLGWQIDKGIQGVTAAPLAGTLISTSDLATVTVTLDRSVPPGPLSQTIPVVFTFGNLTTEKLTVNVPYIAQIQPPVLTIASADFVAGTSTLDFGSTSTSLTVSIGNAGQSTLNWSVMTTGLPAWLSVSPASGAVVMGTPAPVSVAVNRANQASGAYTQPVAFTSDGGNQIVLVNMVVP